MEDYDKIKKTLAVAFMNDLDANRPEGKMCLSNGECADIEKAFNDQDWSKLARYLDKYTESEDERIRKSLINFLSSFELMRDDATFRKGDFDLDAIKGYISYLEKQKENHDGKKWIYEDEYNKELDRLYNDGKDEVLENPEKYWLCKVAEWSEEDKRIKSCIGLALTDVDEQRFKDFGTTLKDCLGWLKSLRPQPHWKPSEEQMNHLSAAVIEAQRRHNESVNGFPRYRVLKELYEQLKKLM